jgi:valyl-tRNA synthetase
MSKTKGNVVDPLAVMEESGADALRFALIHGATPGIDQRFGAQKLENARNFANKLWNATRYVLGARPETIADGATRQPPDRSRLGPAERWILSRAAATTEAVDGAIADYAFGEMTRVLYDEIWGEFCDWGLELAKVRLADASLAAADREATWWTLVDALDTYLRLLHPVMPFITEALWEALPHRETDPELLIVARWPGILDRDAEAESEVAAIVDLVRGIRNARSEAKIEPATWLPVDIAIPQRLGATFSALRPAIERLAHARPLTRHLTSEALRAAAGDGGLAVIAGDVEAVVGRDLGGKDVDRLDRARVEKELAEAQAFLAAARERLSNASFLAKAPEAVVAGARAREAELSDAVDRLTDRLARET